MTAPWHHHYCTFLQQWWQEPPERSLCHSLITVRNLENNNIITTGSCWWAWSVVSMSSVLPTLSTADHLLHFKHKLRSFIHISGLKHFWTGLEKSSEEHERDTVSKAFAQPIPFTASLALLTNIQRDGDVKGSTSFNSRETGKAGGGGVQ